MAINENDLGTPVDDEPLDPVEKSAEELEIEAQARRMGWRPKEEFSRPPERWVDAKTFVEHGMQELPVLRNRYRNLDKQLSTANDKLNGFEQKFSEQDKVLTELREMARTAEDRAYVRALRELTQRERDAVASADTATYDAVQRERADLERLRTAPVAPPPARQDPPPPAAPPKNPVLEAWVAANPWFTGDKMLNGAAIGINTQIQEDYPEWSVEEQLAETKRQVMSRFPEKFPQNTRRAAPTQVATPSTAPARPKGKSVKDLPPEFRDAYARFKKMMPDYTEAEYLKTLGEM